MIRHVGANMETVRRNNRATILKYINDNGPVSRKDMADVMGITPAAVTQICNDLIAEDILFETGENAKSKGAGRKKVLLDINYNVAYVIGISIDSEETTVALSNLKGEVLSKKTLRTDVGISAEEFLEQIAIMCKQSRAHFSDIADKVAMVGVGVPGLVDAANGISKHAYGIWEEEVDVRGILSEYISLPIYVENNVNTLAMAEQYYGIGKDYEHLMLIKWGPGVGCAMIIDQQVYEGRHQKAAELGHFIVDPKGDLCTCGRKGCLETKIAYNVLQRIAPFQEADFGSIYDSDPRFAEVLDLFARTIVNSATIMAPNRIVVTGPLFQSETIRQELTKACMGYDSAWSEERLVYSSLADQENHIGPVALCAKQMLFS